MTRPTTPESELDAILREVAADSNARLLRVTPTFGRLPREDPVGVQSLALTRAERHLLQTHREELGELLRQRCLIEFFAAPDADLRWHRSVTADRELEIPDADDWTSRAVDATELGLGNDEVTRMAEDVLSACVRGNDPRRPGITQLARASLRVAPRDQARVYIALDLMQAGRNSEAMRMYEEVLAESRSGMIRSYCLEGMGVLQSLGPEPSVAVDSYRKSFESDGDRVVPLLNRLVVATAMANRSEAIAAAAAVDERVRPGHDVVGWTRQSTAEHLRRGTRLREGGKELAAQLADAVGPVSREILNVLA